MFYNNISYLVGSANAKLADDMKKINRQKDSSRIERVTNKLNSAQTDNAESSRKQFGRHDSKASPKTDNAESSRKQSI